MVPNPALKGAIQRVSVAIDREALARNDEAASAGHPDAACLLPHREALKVSARSAAAVFAELFDRFELAHSP